jgi:hypothetical protein
MDRPVDKRRASHSLPLPRLQAEGQVDDARLALSLAGKHNFRVAVPVLPSHSPELARIGPGAVSPVLVTRGSTGETAATRTNVTTSVLIWLVALYWLGVFLVALVICRRPVQAAITTIGSIAGAYLLIRFWG